MESILFNEKTIKRLCSNVKVTKKQKSNANEWIKLLESGSLHKERANYFKFAEYVLKDILGYSIKKDLDYEKSNIEFTFTNSKDETVLCIEVKGDSKDLFSKQAGYRKEQETPFKQTWDNMGRIASIKYGICTNYKDFILIDKSKGYSKYHFFNFLEIKTNFDKLKEFIAIFSKENVIDKGFIEKLYEKSIIEEREFTKQFYKLFHETRLMLIQEFQDNGANKDESIHYAQIFLNRLMFVFFAEDTGKLKQRLFEDMVLNLLKVDSVFSENSHMVCNLIKSIFENLDIGSKRHRIFGFNGGLFKEKIPEKIYYKDFRQKSYFNDIYQKSTLKKEIELDELSKSIINLYENNVNSITVNLLYMASFDFNTEVSVNILGHIFEQSISDLEEIKEEKVLRRKKEGVYYTPDFITDFICRNTIITYLSKKNVNTVEKLIDEYTNNIDELQEKFINLKILDPACGSGSFLIKAVDVLLEIHKQIQIAKQIEGQYTAKKVAGLSRKQKRALRDNLQLSFTKWHEEDEAREIIENNIFGVDINEESVEITKLSLFLKIAKKNKKLIDLSRNIKCGNSLIDSSEFVEDRAFNWKKQFPFKFDLVIGNPPYVRVQELSYEHIDYFKENYLVAHKRVDISLMFFELGFKLLKNEGKLGYISSIQFTNAEYGRELRKLLLTKKIDVFIDFNGQPVFEEVTTYPGILILTNSNPKDFPYYKILKLNKDTISQLSKITSLKILSENIIKSKSKISSLTEELWVLAGEEQEKIIEKIKKNKRNLSDIVNPCTGLTTGADKVLIFSRKQVMENNLEKEIILPIIRGRNISRWAINGPFDYVFYPYVLEDNKTILIEESEIKRKYPNMYSYLTKNKNRLLDRKDSRKTVLENKMWYGLIRKGKLNLFNSNKILTPAVSKSNSFALDNAGSSYLCGGAGVFGLVQNEFDNYFLLGVLNSSVVEYFLHTISTKKQGGYYSYLNSFLSQIPIPDKINPDLAIIVKEIIRMKNETITIKSRFLERVKHNLKLEKNTKNLEKFYEMGFDKFLGEISKQGIQLSLKQQDEWEDYFNEYKKELIILQIQIDDINKEINQMIYKLYGLTKEEIAIIEGSIKD